MKGQGLYLLECRDARIVEEFPLTPNPRVKSGNFDVKHGDPAIEPFGYGVQKLGVIHRDSQCPF